MKLNDVLMYEDADLETRRQGEKMIYEILEKKFRENPWFGMYYMDEWNMTPDKIPGLGDLLDSYKRPIITSLLKSMKAGTSDDVSSVSHTIERLTKIGAKWPEMAIISKSLDADKKLDEDDTTLPGLTNEQRVRKNFLGRVHRGDLQHAVSQAVKDGLDGSDPWFADAMAQLKPIFIKRIRYYLNTMMTVRQAAILISVLERAKIKWPEFKTVTKIKRKALIKQMLITMKRAGSIKNTIVPQTIHYLRELGAQWPELNIIERSIEADRGQISEDMFSFLRPKPKPDEHLEHILSLINRERYQAAIYRLGHDPVRKPINKAALGLISSNKHDLIKQMLVQMKQHKDSEVEAVALAINKLKSLGVNWPELAIIEKSLGAGKVLGESAAPFWANMVVKIMLKRALARKFNAPDPDRDSIIDKMDMDDPRFIHTVDTVKDIMLAGLKKLVRHDNLSYNVRGWEQLAKLYQAGFRWPELKGMIEDNKQSVIKALLTAIREDEAEEIESFPATFKSMGIDWPELDIIQRSLNAGSSKTNESWSPYDSMPDPSWLDDKLSSLDRYIKQGNYAYACSTLGYIGNEEYLGPDDFDSKTVRRWRELLDKPNHKNGIMRCLLYNIKHLSDEDAQYNEKIVQALRWLTVSWSELDIIERSMQADAALPSR